MRHKYVYGPVKSWRSGTSLGIDPIGEISTCSFNCSYCQLGKIQNITTEIKNYVKTEFILEDLLEFEAKGKFSFEELDVITFAGSGEPTLAENLDEIIKGINKIQENRIAEGKLKKRVPISILTNATLFNREDLIEKVSLADQISLKLDAPNNEVLKSINQAAEGVTIESIVSGIKKLKTSYKGHLQLQMMFMPKFIKDPQYIEDLCAIIRKIGVSSIQINTPTRPKPLGKEYHIETRGNHPADHNKEEVENYEVVELPVISKEEAFEIEDKLRGNLKELGEIEIINVYKRD